MTRLSKEDCSSQYWYMRTEKANSEKEKKYSISEENYLPAKKAR